MSGPFGLLLGHHHDWSARSRGVFLLWCVSMRTSTSTKVQEIIGASDSSKFYTPKALTSGWTDPVTLVNQKTRETSIAQDPYTVGYYIYTVDGPRVTVDYYADDHGNWKSDNCYPDSTAGTTSSCGKSDAPGSQITPTFHFVRKSTWGYSLNGKEFLVGGANSASYTSVHDSFDGTTATILGGTYPTTATDYKGRVLTQAVDTGWTNNVRADELSSSSTLTLWGMAPMGTSTTDTYALSMSFDGGGSGHEGFSGLGVLVAKDSKGRWVKAVDMNAGNPGGVTRFVVGPWQPQDTLGTYGVDPATNTAWAVINYKGSFAVNRGLDLVWKH